MSERPYVLVSCAMSIDGYLDDATDERLVLSNDADLDRVDAVRASCDAIMVGAATIRRDNPRLLVRSATRRAERVASGRVPSPLKVTITAGGDLDAGSRFFTTADAAPIVFAASDAVEKSRASVGHVAEVVDVGDPVEPDRMLTDLAHRGVQRLMVEGGGTVLTMFLTAGLADELQLVVAPFFVGDHRAPRFVHDGMYPWNPQHPARLAEVTAVGDVVLLRYALSDRFTE